ncbi:MAG: hypothetical protein HY365_03595 [Candidatus Aenigmarchaeota archaeon]|nr:hypothetical protein [Candidatus Aenigmarchaeota archaeon]
MRFEATETKRAAQRRDNALLEINRFLRTYDPDNHESRTGLEIRVVEYMVASRELRDEQVKPGPHEYRR